MDRTGAIKVEAEIRMSGKEIDEYIDKIYVELAVF